jgi:hypothetical protein
MDAFTAIIDAPFTYVSEETPSEVEFERTYAYGYCVVA